MSDNKRDNEYLNELIRYKNNKMSNSERHQFERALERDPFLAEALEGMEDFKISDIDKDLASIDFVAGKRNFRLSPSVYWTVAASIAVLVVAFFFVRNIENKDQLSSAKQPAVEQATPIVDTLDQLQNIDSAMFDLKDSSGVTLLAKAEDVSKEPKASEGKREPEKVLEKPVSKDSSGAKNIQQNTAAKKFKETGPSVMAAVKTDNDSSVEFEENTAVQANEVKEPEIKNQFVKAETTDVDEVAGQPDTEVSVRPGLNAKPKPLGGFDLFKEYIETNLKYPESAEKPSREVVKVVFTVSTTGELVNISVDKAPENNDFSAEAIRLIKNGPKWSPAVKDGVPVEENVNYRIVFKPAK